MNNLRVGDIVWLDLFRLPKAPQKSLLRITAIAWDEKRNSTVYHCQILDKKAPKRVVAQRITIKSSIMKEAEFADESLQLLYGYKED